MIPSLAGEGAVPRPHYKPERKPSPAANLGGKHERQAMLYRLIPVALTLQQRHAIRNKLQLIIAYTELQQPEKVIEAVRDIDLLLGGRRHDDYISANS